MQLSARILLVEDDPATLSGLTMFLEGVGCDVVGASEFDEADGLLREDLFDLLITDLDLPGGTGLQLIRAAYQMRPEMRTILMTAYGCQTVRQEAQAMGLFGYFEKPFHPERMLTLLGERFATSAPDGASA